MKTKRAPAAIMLVLSALAISLAGCNTTAGAGRDLRSAGNAIEDTAEDAKK
jgi:predicted small secreted protein